MSVAIEKIQLPEGATELIIREGSAAPIERKKGLDIKGTIEAPFEYYKKRIPQKSDCVLYVQTSINQLYLVCDASTEYSTAITGKIEISDEYKSITSKDWESESLAKYLRSKRNYFETSEDWLTTIKLFQKFEANVQKSISKENSPGTFRSNVEALTNSSLPNVLRLKIPTVKGRPATFVTFDLFVDVTENHKVVVKLEAPEAEAIIREEIETAIKAQVELFKDEIVTIFQ